MKIIILAGLWALVFITAIAPSPPHSSDMKITISEAEKLKSTYKARTSRPRVNQNDVSTLNSRNPSESFSKKPAGRSSGNPAGSTPRNTSEEKLPRKEPKKVGVDPPNNAGLETPPDSSPSIKSWSKFALRVLAWIGSWIKKAFFGFTTNFGNFLSKLGSEVSVRPGYSCVRAAIFFSWASVFVVPLFFFL